jgi:YVTN family beta-propeller protein
MYFFKNLPYLSLLILIVSCKPKEGGPAPAGSYDNGVFIVNEGSFGNSNGEISFFNRDSKQVENTIFKNVNGTGLGDIVQSMTIYNNTGYIVVNNSNKMEVVNSDDFKSIATVTGFTLPRYFAATGTKGYVTEWVGFSGNGNVKVIDLTTNSISKTIQAGISPEKMLIDGGKVFVTNAYDSTLFVINTLTDMVEDTIFVEHSPTSMVKDINGNIWVLCAGKKDYSDPSNNTPGALVKMNSIGNILSSFPFLDKDLSPSNLIINASQDILYFTYDNKVFSMEISETSLPVTAIINKSFYGLGIDPVTGYIMGGAAKDYIQNDYFYRYNSSGSVIDSFKVGIAPNGFAFY